MEGSCLMELPVLTEGHVTLSYCQVLYRLGMREKMLRL